MKQQFDAIVVGAGMVGATTALTLARKGFSVAVIEKQDLDLLNSELPDEYDLRISAISPSSQQLLDQLGVWQEVQRLRSCDYLKMFVWHQHGNSSMHFSSEQIAVSHLGTIVENRLLQSVLIRHLKHLPNVTFFENRQLESVSQSDNEVRVTIKSEKLLHTTLLIAADGRDSIIRELLRLPVMSGNYQQTAIVANVSTEKSHQNTAWQRFLETGPLAFLPLSNGQSSIVWSADSVRAEELLQLSDDEFKSQLTEAFEYKLGNITSIGKRAGFPLNWHVANKWLEGRVLLIGDAAHGVHPLAGQGVNLGFADVALLSYLLKPGEAIYRRSVLRSFERQRKAEAIAATHLFTALKMLYGNKLPFISWVRNMGMAVVDNNLRIKRRVLQSAVRNMQ